MKKLRDLKDLTIHGAGAGFSAKQYESLSFARFDWNGVQVVRQLSDVGREGLDYHLPGLPPPVGLPNTSLF